jgi:hypothetical protein
MANPYYVRPLGGINLGESITGMANQMNARKEAESAELRKQEGLRKAKEAYESGDPNQVAMVSLEYPELAGQLNSSVGFRNETTRQNMIASLRSGVADPSRIPELIQKRVDLVERQGGDPTETLAELEMYNADPEAYAQKLEQSLALMDPQGYTAYKKATAEPQTKYTNITETKNGKKVGLNTSTGKYEIIPSEGIDFASPSDIPPAGTQEFNQLIEDATGDNEVRAKAARIELGLDPRAVGSASQTIASEGTTEQVAESEAEIAATTAAATDAIEMSTAAIKRLEPIRTKIANYDEAIRAIDAGAGTGVVKSFFPSIKTASIELDNARGFMGLDIIGGTTFGALSESELAFALDTALPTKLEGPELREWLGRKKAAQMKLSQELEKAAIYLGKPGNTPSGYLEFLRNTADPKEVEAQEMTDLVNKYAQ